MANSTEVGLIVQIGRERLPENVQSWEEIEEGAHAGNNGLPSRHVRYQARNERHERIGNAKREENHQDVHEDDSPILHQPHQEVGSAGVNQRQHKQEGEANDRFCEDIARCSVSTSRCLSDEDLSLFQEHGHCIHGGEDNECEREVDEALALGDSLPIMLGV